MRTLRHHHPADHGRGARRVRGGMPRRPGGIAKAADCPIYRAERLAGSRHGANNVGNTEHNMRGDPGVIEFLNKALRHELTAVNQYWLHYRLLDNWGYRSLAKQWRKESIEEMQ